MAKLFWLGSGLNALANRQSNQHSMNVIYGSNVVLNMTSPKSSLITVEAFKRLDTEPHNNDLRKLLLHFKTFYLDKVFAISTWWSHTHHQSYPPPPLTPPSQWEWWLLRLQEPQSTILFLQAMAALLLTMSGQPWIPATDTLILITSTITMQ